MSRTLTYVAGGFLLCWILMWALVFWKRFSPGTAPRILHIAIVFLFFLSSAINPFIDTTRNRVFLLPKWKVRSRTSEADSSESRKGSCGVKTRETATRNLGNEVTKQSLRILNRQIYRECTFKCNQSELLQTVILHCDPRCDTLILSDVKAMKLVIETDVIPAVKITRVQRRFEPITFRARCWNV